MREGEKNVYETYLATTLGLRRRVASAIYASWIVLEGVYDVAQSFDMARHPLSYFITPALFMILTRSYISIPFLRVSFRLIIIAHQLLLISYSLWVIVSQRGYATGGLSELRLGVLCFCLFSELGVLAPGFVSVITGSGKYRWKQKALMGWEEESEIPLHHL